MATWKELGEVPDSDDESTWDSDSAEALPDPPAPLPVSEGAPKTEDTVWDIPQSSQSVRRLALDDSNTVGSVLASQPSSPLSEPSVLGSQHELTPHPPSLDQRSDIFSLDELADDSIFAGPAPRRAVRPPTSQPNNAIPGLPEQSTPIPQKDDEQVETVEAAHESSTRNDEEAVDGTLRLGRSFRPRKPIQEHPYLLESVQYNKTLKSHGVRPIRVQIEEEKLRRQEEDSQEQDYEEESQATAQNTLHGDTEESQGLASLDQPNDVEMMALSDDGVPSPSPPRNRTLTDAALGGSQDIDDEFPDIGDTEKWLRISEQAKQKPPRKRHGSPKTSSKHKLPRSRPAVGLLNERVELPRIEDIFDIPASPPQTSPGPLAITPMAAVNRLRRASATLVTPKPSSTSSSRIQSPAPTNRLRDSLGLTCLDNGDSDIISPGIETSSDSDTEPDQVRAVAKRMRGVLPASWLRLDQHAAAKKPKPTARPRSPTLSPQHQSSTRKGVAQRRLVSPRPNNESLSFLSDDSDESDVVPELREPDLSPLDLSFPIFEDDAVSVVEEDHIDHMLHGSKRCSTSANPPQKRRKGKESFLQGRRSGNKRQQRITGLLSRTKTTPILRAPHHKLSETTSIRRRQRPTIKRTPKGPKPPRLSIIDVIEPDAPAFMRIAARTAGKRRDKGRSSPSNKTIMLGTRQDTIDAASVLRSWKSGSIQPRSPDSVPKDSWNCQNGQARSLASEIHTSIPITSNRRSPATQKLTRFSQPRRMVKQSKMDNFLSTGASEHHKPSISSSNYLEPVCRTKSTSARPAQLEMDGNTANRQTFVRSKKALDALYRQSKNKLLPPQNSHLEQLINQTTDQISSPPLHSPEPLLDRRDHVSKKMSQRPLRRKQAHPRNIDVSAPQFSHANDPLPQSVSPLREVFDLAEKVHNGKLLGLAPFGTHYTQHFEVFPLDHGVFFHQSTAIGSGRLARALNTSFLGDLNRYREQCTFVFDEKTLSWGSWDAQTSSELGIVLDWMVDKVEESAAMSQLAPASATSAVEAAEFILRYLQDHVSFKATNDTSLFACRIVDVLQNLERRMKELLDNAKYEKQSFVGVLNRVLVFVVQALRLCQKLDHLPEAFKIEELIKRFATTAAEASIRTGLMDVHDIYSRLQQVSVREQGIQDHQYGVVCWVTLIRVLEELKIPRVGFWDVVSAVVPYSSVDKTHDAAFLEKVWYELFTLLPLAEFDANGVLRPGLRHTAPLEGWTLPQRLLRRVVELYQANTRQSPSFNEYLRTLVSRCHYLVEQWGWRKSNVILGMIFDFFAAQDLHNLRNEEVYQSPAFLDELSGSPQLNATLDDRCFHIFLKTIALSIRRLQKYGQTKEIRNLVARLSPNHNRQYDKAVATHEAEIAALRNHHDLLCTLFWAAPHEMRPAVQSIEGLVSMGNSHKEACLINIRACRRLSCFIVSTAQDLSAYKPLASWHKNIFNQALEQVLSVECEVDQQLSNMSPEACKNISPEQKNDVIKTNKKVALDTLHFSMKAWLEVLYHTKTLESASFVLNNYPLEQIVIRLRFSSVDTDWGILKVFVDIVNFYLNRIDDFTTQASANQPWHTEEAILLLERKTGAPFIAAVRGLVNMSGRSSKVGSERTREASVEQAVVLAGRLVKCFADAQLLRISQCFQPSKYSIFQDYRKPTMSPSRKFSSLFMASIIESGLTDFKDLHCAPLDMFLAELVKPYRYLAYENRLAMALKQNGQLVLEYPTLEHGISQDYNSNRDLFNHIIVSMRRSWHQAGSIQKQALKREYSKALGLAMACMKADLRMLVSNSTEHLSYIDFVRSVIGLIRSQDLCPVDRFFLEISPEYAPPKQDPRLQMAGILSYGLKLEEGDSGVAPSLFHTLFHNFKFALANGRLQDEREILKDSMRHAQIFGFMLGVMIPAIINIAPRVPESWVLLMTYVEATDARLSTPCIQRQIWGEGVADLLTLHRVVLASAQCLRDEDIFETRLESVIALTLAMKMLNVLSSSTIACLMNEPKSQLTDELGHARAAITNFSRAADEYLSGSLRSGIDEGTCAVDSDLLFAGLGACRSLMPLRHEEQISRFAKNMAQDIRDNWVVNQGVITIKMPSRPQQGLASTQSGRGTPLPQWKQKKVLWDLQEQIRAWNDANDTITRPRLDEALLDDILF